MKNVEMIKIKEVFKGACIVDHAYIYFKNEDIMCICVDMKTRYNDYDGYLQDEKGNYTFYLRANKSTYDIKKRKNIEDLTGFIFIDYQNWKPFSIECEKDIVFVTLINPVSLLKFEEKE